MANLKQQIIAAEFNKLCKKLGITNAVALLEFKEGNHAATAIVQCCTTGKPSPYYTDIKDQLDEQMKLIALKTLN